jgi:protein-S-isoprenylcysteine O-methyltransferase Ste14
MLSAGGDRKSTLKQTLIAALTAGVVGALATRRFSATSLPIKNWPVVASILGFVAFNIYWLAAATNAPARSAESTGSRRVHEILVNFGFLLILLPELLRSGIPAVQYRFVPASPVVSALGLALQAGCFGLAIWARRSLGRNWSGRIEIKTDHELVRSGPYRALRHPIYTAVLGMAVGMAVVIGKAPALLGMVVIALAYVRKIGLEETNMRSAFGPEYDAYRRATWGLVPGLF